MSKIEVNAIEPQTGTTLTLGASGDTVTLAAGATSSGFGATYNGAVNWSSTVQTTGFTAVSGTGYFVNTTSGAITVTLPASPSAGAIVAIADYANTAATNNITVGRNGSKIDGETIDAKIKINGQVYTLVYIDSTEGWKTVSQTYNQITTAQFVTATGGTVTTCGDYKIHVFNSSGCFVVSCAGNPSGSSSVDYLVVAGGGGGGGSHIDWTTGGGAGAGGYRESKSPTAPWTASPLATSTSITVAATTYPIVVGGGGTGSTGAPGGSTCTGGTSGSNSVFSTITSSGGGRGATYSQAGGGELALAGGSGGGGCGLGPAVAQPGNSPPVTPSQGNPGGSGYSGGQSASGQAGGGGGGAGAAGSAAGTGPNAGKGGAGGIGAGTEIFASPTVGTPGPSAPLRYFAGGGGGAGGYCSAAGGAGGGAAGAGTNGPGGAGTTNTGGGGSGSASRDSGGGGTTFTGGNGGSGIVIIKYKYQ